jgi:hypothetical protein
MARIRGTNYMPSSGGGLDSVTGLLSYWYPPPPRPSRRGMCAFSLSQIASEIRMMQSARINNIRLIGSFYGWVIHRRMYMDNLAQLAVLCSQHGISITYQVWTTTQVALGPLINVLRVTPPLASGENLQLLRNINYADTLYDATFPRPLPPGEDWAASIYSEPGNEFFLVYGTDYRQWPLRLPSLIQAYLKDIGTFFGRDPRGIYVFESYDLFNEPDTLKPAQNPTRTFRLIADSYALLAVHHRGGSPSCTVGFAGNGLPTMALFDVLRRPPYSVPLSYFSYHIYPGFGSALKTFKNSAQALVVAGRRRGVRVVCSEFEGVYYTPKLLPEYLSILEGMGIDGQMWGFIQSNYFARGVPVDGVVVPIWPGNFVGPESFWISDRRAVDAVQSWGSRA